MEDIKYILECDTNFDLALRKLVGKDEEFMALCELQEASQVQYYNVTATLQVSFMSQLQY